MIRGVDIVVRYSIFGYLLGEGFRNVFKNKKSTIASLVIMCATMFIFGLFFAVGQNVNHITKTIEEQQGMEVFIYDEATEEQRTELKNKIRSIPYVNTIEEKSKEQALEEMKKMFKDKKFLWALLLLLVYSPSEAKRITQWQAQQQAYTLASRAFDAGLNAGEHGVGLGHGR